MHDLSNKKILIIAGGTGGHIFPALALADELKKMGAEIHWLGSYVGQEQQLVAGRYPITLIPVKAIRGKGVLARLQSPIRLATAFWRAWSHIRKLQPKLVVGMGGFVSGPGGLAAWLMRIPLVIHEQNAIAGFTNQILAKFAKKTLTGFPKVFPAKINAEYIGNPVRDDILALAPPDVRYQQRNGRLRILILGGSQGARSINELILKIFAQIKERAQFTLWHQTGELDFSQVQTKYQALQCDDYKVEKFIHDMAAAYAWADLIICRAGALTVAEIAAAGVASFFIPFPHAVDNHQYYNALFLQQAGAAWLMEQKNLTPEYLQELLIKLPAERKLLQDMANKAKSLAHPEAALQAATLCWQFLK